MDRAFYSPGLTQGVANSLYAQVFNVKAFGAKGDGVANDTPAIQGALTAAGYTAANLVSRTMVQAPPGTYLCTGSSQIQNALVVPPGVTLQGSYSGPITHPRQQSGSLLPVDGTTFLITGGAGSPGWFSFLGLQNNSAVRGISFMWPNQNPMAATPTAYPFAIGPFGNTSQGTVGPCDILIENIEIVNAYQGIDLTGAARHVVRNVFGQALSVGLLIEAILTDVGRLENVHFNPYWAYLQSDGVTLYPVALWQFQNGTAFLIKSTCAQMITNCSVFFANRGVWLTTDPLGNTPYCQFQGLSLDTCRIGVQVDAGTSNPGIQFTSSFIAGEQTNPPTLTTGAAILINSSFASHVRFTNGAIWGYTPAVNINGSGEVVFSDFTFNDFSGNPSVQVNGTGGALFTGCTFNNTAASPPLNCNSGNLTVTGCHFLKQTGPHVVIGGPVAKAVVVGNVATASGSTFQVATTTGPLLAIANNL
jgi:hypothetical protein